MTTREQLENIGKRLNLPQMQQLKKQIGERVGKSLDGQSVKVLVNDIELQGKIVGNKFPSVSIGRYNIEISFNSAYKAVYMGQLLKI